MRLLNTETLELKEFLQKDLPRYAILSHVWDEEELNFSDMKPKRRAELPGKPGYAKVKAFCDLSREDKYQYCWIDTCCIDKRSSAELSEAINSMYDWYRNADICYAYLGDVPAGLAGTAAWESCVVSRWTRGWTLQEILAPEDVIFLDRTWTRFADKREKANAIFDLTGIDVDILEGRPILSASVAKRMSWAAGRHTTRIEDRAYCLLGLFGLNMALIYGEGRKAFVRLQEAIIRDSDDETIFAWPGQAHELNVLAIGPQLFQNRFGITTLKYTPDAAFHFYVIDRPPYETTNKGLRIRGGILEPEGETGQVPKLLPLRCHIKGYEDSGSFAFLAIALTQRSATVNRRYHRQQHLYVCRKKNELGKNFQDRHHFRNMRYHAEPLRIVANDNELHQRFDRTFQWTKAGSNANDSQLQEIYLAT